MTSVEDRTLRLTRWVSLDVFKSIKRTVDMCCSEQDWMGGFCDNGEVACVARTRQCLMKRKTNEDVNNSFEFGLGETDSRFIASEDDGFMPQLWTNTQCKKSFQQSVFRRPRLIDECCGGLSTTLWSRNDVRAPVRLVNVALLRVRDLSKRPPHPTNSMS